MILFFALKSGCRALPRRRRWAGILAGAAIAACAGGGAVAQAPGKIPDLGSASSFAWTPLTINGGIARYGTGWFDPPAGLRAGDHRDEPRRPVGHAVEQSEQHAVALGGARVLTEEAAASNARCAAERMSMASSSRSPGSRFGLERMRSRGASRR